MKLFINAILIFSFLQFAIAQDVEEIIEEVQDKYEEIGDITATFKRVESFKLTGTVSETVGKIYIKDGLKYRFESDDQSIATDGETVWTYNTISKQFIIDRVRKNSGAMLPRDMLFKYPKEYYSTLLRTDKLNGRKVFVIKLDPKENVHGFIKSMKIWVEDNEWLISKIENTDLNDNISTFEISNILIDKGLKDSFFVLKATEEMNVVDMR
jgi:outer membrane lipoprotein-sorting protein